MSRGHDGGSSLLSFWLALTFVPYLGRSGSLFVCFGLFSVVLSLGHRV